MLVTYPTNLNLQLNLHTRRSFLYSGQCNSIFLSWLSSISIATFKTETSTPRLLRRLHTTDSFLFVYCSKVKLFGVPSFPDSSIFLFEGMFSLSRLNFTFFLFLFIVLRFQCSRCFGFSVSRKYFSVLRSVNYRNLHFVSAFQFTTFNHQQVPN